MTHRAYPNVPPDRTIPRHARFQPCATFAVPTIFVTYASRLHVGKRSAQRPARAAGKPHWQSDAGGRGRAGYRPRAQRNPTGQARWRYASRRSGWMVCGHGAQRRRVTLSQFCGRVHVSTRAPEAASPCRLHLFCERRIADGRLLLPEQRRRMESRPGTGKVDVSFCFGPDRPGMEPWNLFAFTFTDWDRSDVLAGVFRERLFSRNGHTLTFADLRAIGRAFSSIPPISSRAGGLSSPTKRSTS